MFKKAELRIIHQNLTRLITPGPILPSTPLQYVEIGGVLETTARMIAEARPDLERGRKILEWRIHPHAAPTANEISGWLARARAKWQVPAARKELEEQIRKLIETTPGLDLCGAQLPRYARVTRFSNASKNVDDNAIDQVGGKLPIDMLKRAGCLVDDSPRWLLREAHAMQTKKGNLHVLVELFEVADEEVPCGPPQDGPQPPDPREVDKERRALTRHARETAKAEKGAAKARPTARGPGLTVGLPE